MEVERSIILQKKMILFLTVVIVAIFSIICVAEKNLNVEKVYMAETEKLDLVTVNASKEENEILRKNIRFFAVSAISKEFNEEDSFTSGEMTSGEQNTYMEAIVPNESESGENISVASDEVMTMETDKVETLDKAELEVKDEEKKLVRYKDLAEDNPPSEYVKAVEVSATAYCLCKKCCGKTPDSPNYGQTCSGLKIVPGSGVKVIAVDPSIIPLNSKVYVEGLNGAWDYGHAVAADTGSAIKELKIDLYMDTHEEALEWGRRKVKVYLLDE